MCTVTVLRRSDRLLLTMNRDERLDRAPEEPPTVRGSDGSIRWIGPRDGEAGGTWIGVSTAGVVACILNGYADGDPITLGDRDAPSRGRILVELLGKSEEAVWEWLHRIFTPEVYPSFTMVVAAASAARVLSWRPGQALEWGEIDPGWSMLTSSAWRTDEVTAWRQREFESWRSGGAPHAGELPAFNLLEEEGREMWSPLMTRPFSATRSLTQVRAGWARGRCELLYWRRRDEEAVDPAAPDVRLGLDISSEHDDGGSH
jgi:hypothetical protein